MSVARDHPILFGQPPAADTRTADRAAAKVATDAAIERSGSRDDPRRAAAMERLEACLCAFLRLLGAGAEFQAIEFTSYAKNKDAIDPILDKRSPGAVIVKAKNRGLIVGVDFRNNGGSAKRNYHGTPRTVWRIKRVPNSNVIPERTATP